MTVCRNNNNYIVVYVARVGDSFEIECFKMLQLITIGTETGIAVITLNRCFLLNIDSNSYCYAVTSCTYDMYYNISLPIIVQCGVTVQVQ